MNWTMIAGSYFSVWYHGMREQTPSVRQKQQQQQRPVRVYSFYANKIYLIQISESLLSDTARHVNLCMSASSWAVHTNLFVIYLLKYSWLPLHSHSNAVYLHSVVQSIASWQTIYLPCTHTHTYQMLSFCFRSFSHSPSSMMCVFTCDGGGGGGKATTAGNANFKRKSIDRKKMLNERMVKNEHPIEMIKNTLEEWIAREKNTNPNVTFCKIRFYTNSSPFKQRTNEHGAVQTKLLLLKWSKLNSPFRQNRIAQQQ